MLNPLDYRITNLNKIPPKKGRLLISEPFMNVAYFKRSVVLITEHNKNGVVGIILNKPVDPDMNKRIQFGAFDAPLSLGGPVQSDHLYYIHTQGNVLEGSQHVVGDIYWGGNFEQLKQLIEDQQLFPNEILFFMGYAGWSFGQLQEEIKEESWIVSEVQNPTLKDLSHPELWKNTLENMGPSFAEISKFPVDPSLN